MPKNFLSFITILTRIFLKIYLICMCVSVCVCVQTYRPEESMRSPRLELQALFAGYIKGVIRIRTPGLPGANLTAEFSLQTTSLVFLI